MIPFFCGQGPTCKRATKEAFETARNNLVSEYFLVGITEQFDDMVTILEKLIPSYFNGLSQKWATFGWVKISFLHKYKEFRSLISSTTSTSRKVRPSSAAMDVLTKRLEYEIELYSIALSRFYQIKRTLFLRNQLPSFMKELMAKATVH